MKYILLVLVFVFPLLSQEADVSKLGGLRFSGNYAKPTPSAPVPHLLSVEKRSLFDLTADEKIYAGSRFTIEFSLSLWDNRYGGEVFKVSSEGYSISLLFSVDNGKRMTSFGLNLNGKPSGYRFSFDQDNVYEGKWFPVRLMVDLKSGELGFSFSGKDEKLRIAPSTSDGFYLRFGRDGSGSCLPMEIRELKIFAEERLKHYWKFNELSGDVAYDAEGGLDVKTLNCEWVINRHFYWEFVRPEVFRPASVYRHSGTDNEYFGFDTVKTRIVNLRSKTYTDVPFVNPPRIQGVSRGSVENDSLMAFQTGYPDKPLVINFRTGQWIMRGDKYTPEGHVYAPVLILDPRSMDVYIFGGYGWYKFKNNLLKFNRSTGVWDTLKTSGEKPNPVQYAVLFKGKSPGEYWITGGIGNESGEQADGNIPQWKLFKLDLNTLTWQKKWEWHDTTGQHIQYSGVWANSGFNAIYAVTKSKQEEKGLFKLVLLRLDSENVVFTGEHLPTPMSGYYAPQLFIDHETDILYIYSPIEGYKDSLSLFGSIRTPILTKDQYQYLLENSTPVLAARRQKMIGYILIGMVSISVPAAAWAGYRRRAQKRGRAVARGNVTANDRNFITLFGGLKIVNAAGVNIHEKLTHGLSELFSLIYYYTVFSPEKGIKPDECAKLFWTWIDEDNLSNNRKVSFSKLRRVLNENSGIRLEQRGEYAMISVPAACIDETRLIFDVINGEEEIPSNEKIDRVLKIISRGEFLEGVTSEWASQARNATISRILKRASGIMSRLRAQGEHAKVLEIAGALMKQDPLSEEVLKMRVLSLLDLGEGDEAKMVYSRFKRDYTHRYGEEFPYDLDEFTEM